MLKIEQYQKLKAGDQIRYAKGVYTVHGHEDFGTHRECKLISDEGDVLHNGIYITHLMAYHGSVDVEPSASPQAGVDVSALPLASLTPSVIVEPVADLGEPSMTESESRLLSIYLAAELI